MVTYSEEVKQKESLNASKDAIKNSHQQVAHVGYSKKFYIVYDFCSNLPNK